MSDPRVPAPVDAVIRAIAGGSADTGDERTGTFTRGLALGALVGAAIAGSTIWQRRRSRTDSGSTGRPGLPPDGARAQRD